MAHINVYATDVEWATVRERAEEAGWDDVSPFVIACALASELSPDFDSDIPLTHEEGRDLYNKMIKIASDMQKLTKCIALYPDPETGEEVEYDIRKIAFTLYEMKRERDSE